MTSVTTASLLEDVPDAIPTIPTSPPLNVAQALLRRRRVSRPMLTSGSIPPPTRRRRLWFGPDVYRRDLIKIIRGREAARALGNHHPIYQALEGKATMLTLQLERCLQRVEQVHQQPSSFSSFQTVSSSDLSQLSSESTASSPTLTQFPTPNG
jgi:hypothetical protein